MSAPETDRPQPGFDPGDVRAEAPVGTGSRRTWLRRLYMTLRTEHRTPAKVGVGVGLGVFVGCSPLWGVHLPMAVLLATLFRLNRAIVYASAYIGNPLTAAPMLFAEVQIGHRILHGVWLPVTISNVETLGFLGIFADLMLGSAVLGLLLGVILGSYVQPFLYKSL